VENSHLLAEFLPNMPSSVETPVDDVKDVRIESQVVGVQPVLRVSCQTNAQGLEVLVHTMETGIVLTALCTGSTALCGVPDLARSVSRGQRLHSIRRLPSLIVCTNTSNPGPLVA